MLVRKLINDGIMKSYYDSSNILVSEYDQSTKNLIVIFKNGGKYEYKDVSISDYTRFELADSQGKVLNSHIKQYPFEALGKVDISKINEEIDDFKLNDKIDLQKSFISLASQLIDSWENDSKFNDNIAKLLSDKLRKYYE